MVDRNEIVRNSLYALGVCLTFGMAGYFLGKSNGEDNERKRTIEALTARASYLHDYANSLDSALHGSEKERYNSRVVELKRFADSLKVASSRAGRR